MARPPIDLDRKIKDIVQHVQEMPADAEAPLAHYRKTGTDLWNSILYVERAFAQPGFYRAVADRHLGRINSMVMTNLIENFERFLKETAAACVDYLADYLLDDRLSVFGAIQGSRLASHFGTGTLGKSLCESGTWLNCEEINARFRKLLSDPFEQGGGKFWLFPTGRQQPANDLWRTAVLGLIWQLRHTIVHNVGVITQSDAVKLRLLARERVVAPRILTPTREDLRYVKKFLDETADVCNQRIGERLAELLTSFLQDAPNLFVAQDKANELAATFGICLRVDEHPGVVPT
jgi:hypothetical protein